MSKTEILDAIGGTPLVELRRVVPDGHARVFVKVEGLNPTGSLKDRMAVSVVDRAVADGRLPQDGRLVEYSGGSTGTSLAFVCAARGIATTIVCSDAFALEKRNQMRALGAVVEDIPSDAGRITRDLIRAMMARAAEVAEEPGSFYADQFENPDAAAGYRPIAQEAWDQTNGKIDSFVHSVGTAQSITGIGAALRALRRDVEIVAVEPAESAVLGGGRPGGHQIEGIGAGFVPPLWTDETADRIEAVTTEEAMEMARRLAKEEALFAGTSSGGNVVAAIRRAREIGPGGTVVTLLCDSGLKYLSTELYRAA